MTNSEPIKYQLNIVFDEMNVEKMLFPKYSTQFINLANQNSKWTSPKIVWQMSDLIKEIPENTLSSWKDFYLSKNEDKIEIATEMIRDKTQEMKDAYDKITKQIVRKRVYDLIINKTAEWLIIQEFIFKELSKKFDLKYQMATPKDEAKNIDWFLWWKAIQIKPESYKSKKATVRSEIEIPIIYYKKTAKYLSVDCNELNI